MDIFSEQDRNKRKSIFLVLIFIVFITLLGAIFGAALGLPQEEWVGSIIFALIFSSISAFVSYFFSDKIVLMISGAKKVDPEKNKELYRILENLCMASGLPIPKFYIIDDTAPNAFATGRNAEHGVVCVTTGLLQKLDRSELEGVIAHELAHIGNRDILFMTLVSVLVGTVSLLSDLFLRFTYFNRGGKKHSDENGNGQIQIVLIIAGLVLAIFAPIIAILIQLAISRKREFLADATGAQICQNPEALARALDKISKDTEPLEAANSATAHLYIVNPLKDGQISKLFSTHPPVEERIAKLLGMVGK
ncbi:MAG: zinc metalloprotease HtpX [Patescibacteria group bacterium]